MHHLILGYGYCGYYLAQELVAQGVRVTTVSRHVDPLMQLKQVTHLLHDLAYPFSWSEQDTIVYYLIPPQATGIQDLTLKYLLTHSSIKCHKVIYFGSSAVYGQHKGAWVNEESPCIISQDRQLRRLDAEQQWLDYCLKHNSDLAILRIAGIYGPNRLPITAAQAQTPVIIEEQTPYTNHIYVKDLAAIAYALSQMPTACKVYNVADGNPQPMGTIQKLVAKALNLPPAPTECWQEAWDKATAMKREFMGSSKLLEVKRLHETLGSSLSLTPLATGIMQSLSSN